MGIVRMVLDAQGGQAPRLPTKPMVVFPGRVLGHLLANVHTLRAPHTPVQAQIRILSAPPGNVGDGLTGSSQQRHNKQ